MNTTAISPALRQGQRGAALFVALTMLLLITLLAVTSMREVALEARVTGNLIEQKRLTSAAESALRESERRTIRNNFPPDTCVEGSNAVLCIEEIADDYDANFSGAIAYSGIDGETSLDRTAYWYVRDTGIISSSDPECFLTGKNCVSYYEINSQAFQGSGSGKTCGPDALCIRSVVAAIYD